MTWVANDYKCMMANDYKCMMVRWFWFDDLMIWWFACVIIPRDCMVIKNKKFNIYYIKFDAEEEIITKLSSCFFPRFFDMVVVC